SSVYAEPLVDAFEMPLHGPDADLQGGADLTIGEARRDECEHFALPPAKPERGQRLRRRRAGLVDEEVRSAPVHGDARTATLAEKWSVDAGCEPRLDGTGQFVR